MNWWTGNIICNVIVLYIDATGGMWSFIKKNSPLLPTCRMQTLDSRVITNKGREKNPAHVYRSKTPLRHELLPSENYGSFTEIAPVLGHVRKH